MDTAMVMATVTTTIGTVTAVAGGTATVTAMAAPAGFGLRPAGCGPATKDVGDRSSASSFYGPTKSPPSSAAA